MVKYLTFAGKVSDVESHTLGGVNAGFERFQRLRPGEKIRLVIDGFVKDESSTGGTRAERRAYRSNRCTPREGGRLKQPGWSN